MLTAFGHAMGPAEDVGELDLELDPGWEIMTE